MHGYTHVRVYPPPMHLAVLRQGKHIMAELTPSEAALWRKKTLSGVMPWFPLPTHLVTIRGRKCDVFFFFFTAVLRNEKFIKMPLSIAAMFLFYAINIYRVVMLETQNLLQPCYILARGLC